MQAHLSWSAARSLAASGSRVRRAGWTDRYVFRTRGGLHWLGDYAGTYKRVIRAADFQRPEFLALDWTDADPDQNHCVGIEADTYKAGEVVSYSPAPVWTDGNFSSGTLSAGIASVDVPSLPGRAFLKLELPHNTSPVGGDGRPFILIWIERGGVWVQTQQTATGRGYFEVSPGSTIWIGKPGTYEDGRPFPATPVVVGGTWEIYFSVPSTPPAPDTSNYGLRKIANPFAAPVSVVLTGSVNDTLLLNGAPVRSGAGFDPVSFQLASGGSFTIAARSVRTDFPFYIGYDLAATFTV